MTSSHRELFAPRGDTGAIERGREFQPKFDADGLIGAIVTERATGSVLMFAHMSPDSLRLTIETGVAHFWSRSRRKLWKKGEESGNVLNVREVRTDCDQDCLLVIVDVAGAGVACHTGARSCFYRKLECQPGQIAEGPLRLADVAPHPSA